jgi:6-pyruvoyl-tetrahydropterin synthase
MEMLRVHSDFHAAHRQLEYPGKCRFIHGHTWKGTIVVSTTRFPRNELDMSIDFGDLKDCLRHLDHKLLVSEGDEGIICSGFEPEGLVVIPGKNPSVENVCWYCLGKVKDVIAGHYGGMNLDYHIEVTIQETDNNIFSVTDDVVI